MYTDDFSATINTSDKKALKQFFEQSCADIVEEHDETNCISECLLKIVDEENNKKCCICFDIVSIDSKYSYINVLFYPVWDSCENEVIKVLTDEDDIDVENITVYFYTRANS